MSEIYLGLVHSPVVNKRGQEVTTSVTNLDVHDIARSCRTFGIKRYFIVTPIVAQHKLLERILGHWSSEKGELYNADRSDALSCISIANSIEQCTELVKEESGNPLVAVTGARLDCDGEVSDLIQKANLDNRPVLVLFGTGWGLSSRVVESADYRLAPINGAADYNHLSVRSAVAIYCDRINQTRR